jgi:hypothetical protein
MVKPTQIILGKSTVQEEKKKQFEGLQIQSYVESTNVVNVGIKCKKASPKRKE